MIVAFISVVYTTATSVALPKRVEAGSSRATWETRWPNDRDGFGPDVHPGQLQLVPECPPLRQRADTSVSGTRQRHSASPALPRLGQERASSPPLPGKMHCSHALKEAGQHLVEVLEGPVKFLGGDGERWRDA
jgi:hypothetical protein